MQLCRLCAYIDKYNNRYFTFNVVEKEITSTLAGMYMYMYIVRY